ncbi:hypothetical protein C8R45DRAFT_919778 [Mycena sanguinolenta]|nr:hypothetical protein C8R45DRAFT_919778 [Mycena sanguinolenta]
MLESKRFEHDWGEGMVVCRKSGLEFTAQVEMPNRRRTVGPKSTKRGWVGETALQYESMKSRQAEEALQCNRNLGRDDYGRTIVNEEIREMGEWNAAEVRSAENESLGILSQMRRRAQDLLESPVPMLGEKNESEEKTLGHERPRSAHQGTSVEIAVAFKAGHAIVEQLMGAQVDIVMLTVTIFLLTTAIMIQLMRSRTSGSPPSASSSPADSPIPALNSEISALRRVLALERRMEIHDKLTKRNEKEIKRRLAAGRKALQRVMTELKRKDDERNGEMTRLRSEVRTMAQEQQKVKSALTALLTIYKKRS